MADLGQMAHHHGGFRGGGGGGRPSLEGGAEIFYFFSLPAAFIHSRFVKLIKFQLLIWKT